MVMPTLPTIDLSTLTQSMPWKRLSLAQKVFVKAYILNDGNALAAAKIAYPKASPVSIRSMGWETRHAKNVEAALNWWAGKDNRARMIELVEKQIAAAEPGSVAASRLLAQLERLTLGSAVGQHGAPKETPSDGVQRYAVGDVVTQNGHMFQIVAQEIKVTK